MRLDPKNVERLRQVGSQLRKESLASIPSSNSSKQTNSKLHRIETEENPKELFRALIEASTNGEIPEHLITRLKEIEKKERDTLLDEDLNKSTAKSDNGITNKRSLKKKSKEEVDYVAFARLLLEED